MLRFMGGYRYVILDRDTKFDAEVLRSIGLKPKRTSRESPWQNGVAERWIGRCRRELLDYVIQLNERHLRRLIRHYVRYYHLDRTHDGLGKDTPDRSARIRVLTSRPQNSPRNTLLLYQQFAIGCLSSTHYSGTTRRFLPSGRLTKSRAGRG